MRPRCVVTVPLTNAEMTGDLPRRQTLGCHLQHLVLASSQLGLDVPRPIEAVGDGAHPVDRGAGQDGLAPSGLADRLEELDGIDVLVQVPIGPQEQPREMVVASAPAPDARIVACG